MGDERCCTCGCLIEGGPLYDLRRHPLCLQCANTEHWCNRCRGTYPAMKLGLMGLCWGCLEQEDEEHYQWQQMNREECS